MSGVVFLMMWLMAFSVLTSLLTAAGCCVVVVAASAVSDLVELREKTECAPLERMMPRRLASCCFFPFGRMFAMR